MFDNSMLEAYRAVKAPESLRQKVFGEAALAEPVPKNDVGKIIGFKKFRSLGLAVAACLILAVGSWGLLGGGVSVETQTPDSGISLAREIETCETEIKMSQRGFSRVNVSCGELVLNGKTGQEFSVFGGEVLTWRFSGDCRDGAVITVSRYGKEITYTLVQNADSGEFEICPAE